MKPTDDILESAGEAYGYARTYAEQMLEYYKLEIAERVSLTISSAITMVVILMIFLIGTLFFSLAMGMYLADVLGSSVQAFLAVGGIYALLAIIILVFRRQLIVNVILSRMIKVFFQKERI
jgi:hypothetical protein